MYLTILNYDDIRGNRVITFELPEYTRGFQVESIEEYISVTLGFNVGNIDWQTHEDLPELVELHNQEYA
jgi:hypothetical protein|tara:strand:+ start:261 stop:467 length:207 start_codon:yes stop_codon:yes gene_type:complete